MEKASRKQALRIAQRLGCYGAHQVEDGSWRPCPDPESLKAVMRGEKMPQKKSEQLSVPEYRYLLIESKSGQLFSSREEALQQSRRNGCNKVRVVMVNGGRMYAACMPKNNGRPENTGMIPPSPKQGWENLEESGVMGIDTLPSGGLVSGKSIGRSIGQARRITPSMRDGDGDGMMTGPDGRDNIPAPKVPSKKKPKDEKPKPGLEYRKRFRRQSMEQTAAALNQQRFSRNNNSKPTAEEPYDEPGLGDDPEDIQETLRLQNPVGPTYPTVSEIDKAREEAEKWRLEVIARRKREREEAEKDSSKKKQFDVLPLDAKGFVNFVSRSTDPDVFTDPDSARVRARQIGCIGIRSYTARDGKRVWLPCTNTSDYNRRMNLRPDGWPKKKDESEEKSLAKTPAPKKDRIIGSDKNRVGSAGSIRSAGTISMDADIVQSLTTKVREHNKAVKKANKEKWAMTNLRTLKAVYRRGAGAFSVSHRPGMTRNQWAMGRVNAYLRLLMTGSAKASYVTDNDLLPKGHPWKKRGLGSKSFMIDDVEYVAEYSHSAFSERYPIPYPVNRYVAFALPEEIS